MAEAAATMTPMYEVRSQEDGIDEVVVQRPALVHLERMDTGEWSLILDFEDDSKGRLHIALMSKRPGRTAVTAHVLEEPTP